MRPLTHTLSLLSAGREVTVPFRAHLNSSDLPVDDGQPKELLCTEVLRILPGKRLVCQGEFNGQPVIAKFFLNPRDAKRHCNRELKGITALRDARIKTPALLFKGVLAPDNASPVLVFQRISPVIDFITALRQKESDAKRIELLKTILSVIAQQHAAGLKQDDLHLRNFLFTGDEIYTIDGSTVDTRRKGSPLAINRSLKNIGLFFTQLSEQFDYLVPQLFPHYLALRKWEKNHRLLPVLMKQIRRHRYRATARYLKKIYRESTAYICRKSWHQFMVCGRNSYTDSLKRFFTDPDTAMNEGRVLKKGNASTVVLINLDGNDLVVKRYNMKTCLHAIRRSVVPSRAWVSWQNAHRLNLIGIPTPEPIAFMEKRWGPFRSKAYFITPYIAGRNLYDLLHSSEAEKIDLSALVRQFGTMLHLFATKRICHGDFKATNFIVSDGKIYVIDLDALREYKSLWRFRRPFKRDLKRLMKNWETLPEIAGMFQRQVAKIESCFW